MNDRYLPPEARALVETFPDGWATVVGFQGVMGRCVESSRLIVAVLTQMKVPCKPLACDTDALNDIAVEQMLAGNLAADWPVDAWVVSTRCDARTSGASYDEPEREAGFGGHLVVVGTDWFLDVTAGQMERRPRRIFVKDTIAGPYDPADDGVDVALARGGRLRYFWRPEIRHFRSLPAWRQDLHPLHIETAARAVRHKLDPTQPPPMTTAEFRVAMAATNGHRRPKKGRR